MKTILVVDDDSEIRETLCELLADEGYRSVGAADGRQALFCLHEREQVDAIVLDLMMPVMDGRQFRSEQLAVPDLAKIPVILATAGADPAAEAEQMGAAAWFRKPFDLDQLLQELSRVLGDA